MSPPATLKSRRSYGKSSKADALASQIVAAPRALGGEIMFVMGIGAGPQRHCGGDADPGRFEPGDLARIVGKETHLRLGQRPQHPRGDREVALVIGEAEAQVGVHRIESLVLQRISAQLVDQTDAPALLAQIEKDA